MAKPKRKSKTETKRVCARPGCGKTFSIAVEWKRYGKPISSEVGWKKYCSASCGDRERHRKMDARYRKLRDMERAIRQGGPAKRTNHRPTASRRRTSVPTVPPRLRNRRVNPRSLEQSTEG